MKDLKDFTKDMKKEEQNLNETQTGNSIKADVSGSYVVFEDSYDNEGLVQLSVTLPTLERAREYVKGWKSKRLYIYLLVE